jgi:acetyltransferase-like isoleucine patch superfamily enzyme
MSEANTERESAVKCGRLRRGLRYVGRSLRKPMRLFRLLEWCRTRWVYRWNVWRLRTAGVSIGRGLILEGSIRVGCGSNVVLGDNVHLGDGVYLGAFPGGRLEIGADSYIGRGSTILAYEQVTIGKDCLLAPYTYITDVNHGFSGREPIRLQPYAAQPVAIGDDVWFGVAVKVMPGVLVGDGAVVGAGSVVTGQIAARSVAVGVPARVIRQRD